MPQRNDCISDGASAAGRRERYAKEKGRATGFLSQLLCFDGLPDRIEVIFGVQLN
jgi:hypothetical protein